MAHTIVIGGQPDFIQYARGLGGSWTAHGREITSGDAEKVMDGAPSVRYRAKSIGSGEFFFKMGWGSVSPERNILGVCHNLSDVGAKVRVVTGGTSQVSQVLPTATVVGGTTNTASVFGDVDQDPYGSISTWATPTVATSNWSLEVGFDNAAALQTHQVILVLVRFQGTPVEAQTILIQAKEGATVKAFKTLEIQPDAASDTFVFSLLVDKTTFSDQTLDGMSVKVAMDGVAGGTYWEVGSIVWLKVVSGGLGIDTGWTAVEQPAGELFYMASDAPVSSILPYLDTNGEVTSAAGTTTFVLFTWDDSADSVGVPGPCRPRIFDSINGGTLTNWRPEIGLIAEGPAYGTRIEFGFAPSWSDPSIVRTSKGGNDWTIRREPRRKLAGSSNFISATDFATELFSVMRRAGISRPFCVAVKPASGFNQSVKEAVSLYGRCGSFDSSNVGSTTEAPGDGYWRASMTFEEVV